MGELDEAEVRRRFHEQANNMHKLEARVLMAEGAIHILERDVKNAATLQQMQGLTALLEQKLDQVRGDLYPVRMAVYGLIGLIVAAFITAVATGVFK